MSDDRSLAEFSSAAVGSETDEQTTEPPTVTYRCRPAGFVCSRCGAETETQWADEGVFVCPDCKPWA